MAQIPRVQAGSCGVVLLSVKAQYFFFFVCLFLCCVKGTDFIELWTDMCCKRP